MAFAFAINATPTVEQVERRRVMSATALQRGLSAAEARTTSPTGNWPRRHWRAPRAGASSTTRPSSLPLSFDVRHISG